MIASKWFLSCDFRVDLGNPPSKPEFLTGKRPEKRAEVNIAFSRLRESSSCSAANKDIRSRCANNSAGELRSPNSSTSRLQKFPMCQGKTSSHL
jgi:hypothetical protein